MGVCSCLPCYLHDAPSPSNCAAVPFPRQSTADGIPGVVLSVSPNAYTAFMYPLEITERALVPVNTDLLGGVNRERNLKSIETGRSQHFPFLVRAGRTVVDLTSALLT
jgi:hypothetical protein